MNAEIIVVSGLPRSGTSLMMQMLARGGIEVLTDNVRRADVDNPRGYYEYERVKKIKDDAAWLPAARGKALKMVSQLLYHLPPDERYRIIFMRRDLDETLTSQEKMLERLGRPAGARSQIKESFTAHLTRLEDWLARQPNIDVLYVAYNGLLEKPEAEAARVSAFLHDKADAVGMAAAVDQSLYRNRLGPGRVHRQDTSG
jgi:hypothetical protein